MTASSKRAATLGALFLSSLLLYGIRLGAMPRTVGAEETLLASQARMIAATGRDGAGRVLPVYISVDSEKWLQPIPVYFTALWLGLSPSSVFVLRLPSALLGATDVVLMYLVALRIFRRDRLALLAAALLAITPSHFFHSRLALDAVYPVPFVLLWLWALVGVLDGKSSRGLALATAALGVGCYTQPAALTMMPAFLVVTLVVLWRRGRLPADALRAALGGFAAPLLPAAAWFIAHPRTYIDTIGRWALPLAYVRFPLDGIRAAFNWGTLTLRLWLFWDFFSPSYLFLQGGSGRADPAAHAGVLLLPLLVLVPLGLRQALTRDRATASGLVVAVGFIIAPLAAAIFLEPRAIARELVLLPFAVLLAVHGAVALLNARHAFARAGGILLLALLPVCFAWYAADYFGDDLSASALLERHV